MSARARTVSALHRVYKYVLSPALHAFSGVTGACRFQPTCSEYATLAVSEYGILRGGLMSVWRVLRCHPLCAAGFEPVRPNPTRVTTIHSHCDSARYHNN